MSCPSCGAEQIIDHPAGILVYSHGAQCAIGDSENATKANDHSLLTNHSFYGTPPSDTLVRATTQAENVLLVSLGYLPCLVTTCTRLTIGGGVVNRSFDLVAAPE